MTRRLPSTDMHHGWQVAVYALSCLLADIRTQRSGRRLAYHGNKQNGPSRDAANVSTGAYGTPG